MRHTYQARYIQALRADVLLLQIAFAPFGLIQKVCLRLEGYFPPEPLGPTSEMHQRARAALDELMRSGNNELTVTLKGDQTAQPLYEGTILLWKGDAPLDVADALIGAGWGREQPAPYLPTDTYPAPVKAAAAAASGASPA